MHSMGRVTFSESPELLNNILRYYQFCVIDALSNKGAMTRAQLKSGNYHRIPKNVIPSTEVLGGGQSGHGTAKSDALWLWHPLVFERQVAIRHSNTTHAWAPEALIPLCIPLAQSATGEWRVAGRPRIARECLEPSATDTLVLGTLEDADQFYSKNPFPDIGAFGPDPAESETITPDQALGYAYRLWETVVKRLPEQLIPGVAYQQAAHSLITPARQLEGAIKPLVSTLNAIETLQPETPCLFRLTQRVVSDAPTPSTPCERLAGHFRLWGTLTENRKLSDGQRTAVTACLSLPRGSNQAIHGPPGTGKTALLQDMIATATVQSVLADSTVPLIAITSTNNQAIRNALESLTTAPGEQIVTHSDTVVRRRWLPYPASMGYYEASQNAEAQAQKLNLPTAQTMSNLEANTNIPQASMTFIQNARTVTQNDAIGTVAEATDALRRRLKAEAREQLFCRSVRSKLAAVESSRHMHGFCRSLKAREAVWIKNGWLQERDAARWRALNAESQIALKLFQEADAALKECKAREGWEKAQWRGDRILLLLRPFRNVKGADKMARQRLKVLAGRQGTEHSVVSAHRDDAKQARQQAIGSKDRLARSETLTLWEDAAESVLHAKARPTWFWLALHVREGEWLQLMEQRERTNARDGRSFEKVKDQLHRRSLIAPVMVATLHRLPKVMSYWDAQRQAEMPLLNALDWLIVDEAGQCAPDIAAASVSLTQRLIALGDLQQLEPVWSVEEREDHGNRVASGLITAAELHSDKNRRITDSGSSTSSGSLLALAQHSTHFVGKDDRLQSLGKGLWLTEHRRCHPAIIGYCNELAYQGTLKSLTEINEQAPLPPLGYLDCAGRDESDGGSRRNVAESALIAAWVAEHEKTLIKAYGRPIGEIVGIITPFKAQADGLEADLTRALGKGHAITCGTVHSLQGAQRPVVILSLCYSAFPAPKSLFFDRTKSMLNVAASRAQDSLIVAGDLDCLYQGLLPSQLLAKHLRDQGKRLAWPENIGSPEFNNWIRALQTTFGEKTGVKACDQESVISMALDDQDIRHIVLQASDISRTQLQKMGNKSIAAARRGAQVQWILPFDKISSHPDSQSLIKGLEIMSANGVTVTYTKPSFRNMLVLPEEGLAFWAPRSWLGDDAPDRIIGLQNDLSYPLNRLEQLHGASVSANSESAKTA